MAYEISILFQVIITRCCGITWTEVTSDKDEKKPEETESKEVKTFGEFVKYCVEPTIKWQAKAAAEKAAAEKALAEKKGDKK